MTITTWPAKLVPQRASFNLRNSWKSGGRNVFGREQRVRSDAGFWAITLSGILIHDRATEYAFRALVARLRDGEDVFVPMFGFRALLNSADTDDSACELTDAADLRATTINITSSGVQLLAGGMIGIFGRLHQITEITTAPSAPPFENMIANDSPWRDGVPFVDAVSASANYVVKILPPLRSDYSAGQTVKTSGLTVRCVLESGGDGDLEMQPGGIAYPTLTFVEHIE